MKINQSNYEIFFLDYLDGKLPDNQVDEFLDFLKKNPQLKEELKAVEDLKLAPEEYQFSGKEELLRNNEAQENTFDYRAIAFIENDLSEEDQKLFLEEMESDAEKEREFDLLLSTKLIKEEINYPDKKSLYRKDKKRALYIFGRIAAVLILLLAIGSIFQKNWKIDSETESVFTEALPPIIHADKEADPQKDEPVKKQKSIDKIKKAVTDSIPTKEKSIREKAKGRLKEIEDLTGIVREPAPHSLQAIYPDFVTHSNATVVSLHQVNTASKTPENYMRLDEYLSQKLKDLTTEEKTSDLNRIASVGLEKMSNYSNDKISYQKNSNGKISEINLKTGLLAFSIPIKKNR
ncbi:hypothetical protein ACUNWD_03540 [Sunxiuqinia sp. A32]|uniref:hypothetical protein n=1 Tax=Sunxiuqinia sp. A32 TaxID=3461496 RepID=UPI0040462417